MLWSQKQLVQKLKYLGYDLKLISFFEDFDEVFINFNLNSVKKEKKYLNTVNLNRFKLKKKKKIKIL